MTREKIGSYLGLKLETVSRTFSRFQDEKLIGVQQKFIRIQNSAGLERSWPRSGLIVAAQPVSFLRASGCGALAARMGRGRTPLNRPPAGTRHRQSAACGELLVGHLPRGIVCR